MIIIIKTKDTDEIIGLKEDIVSRIEDIADVERVEVYADKVVKPLKVEKPLSVAETIEKVNAALNIKLRDWQIDYIFRGRAYPAEVEFIRCNGKTLTHILRICLKTDEDIKEPIILKRLYDERTLSFLQKYAGADYDIRKIRLRNFVYNLKEVYGILSTVEGLKLREIIF